MFNRTMEYTLTQDELQVHVQMAIDSFIDQAKKDAVINERTAKELSQYVALVQTSRGFTDRLRKLLGMKESKPNDNTFQITWFFSKE